MKRILLTIGIVAAMMSCKKEEVEPIQPSPIVTHNTEIDTTTNSCLCGGVTDYGMDTGCGIDNEEFCYWIEIKNDCSDNKKKFSIDSSNWTSKKDFDRLCLDGKFAQKW